MTDSKKEMEMSKVMLETIENSLNEGIDFNNETLTVTYNPSHERNVDTSLENNPTIDNSTIDGIPVWSIFKRKRGLYGDGNPLVYALKGERGWKFGSDADREAIEKRFDEIAVKFATMYPIGVTIVIPSGNELNRHIAEVITSKSKNAKIIEGALCKLTTEEVNDIVLEKDSVFREKYMEAFESAYRQLCIYFGEMDRERGGDFSRHFVKDNTMRNVLKNTLKATPDRCAKDSKYINNQDVLIIDDTVGSGQSIREACQIMNECYFPKSITVLTLLSKLY